MTTIALIADEYDVVTVAQTIKEESGESFGSDVTAKFQINVGTNGVVLDFSFFGDDMDQIREDITKERVALDKFVNEVLDFQRTFNGLANNALSEA